MPLDPSIIQSGKPLDIMTPMNQAMTMVGLNQKNQAGDLELQQKQRDFGDQSALRKAYENNTTVDQNGNASINRAGIMSDLAKTSPSQLPTVQQNFATQDFNTQKMKLDAQSQQHDMIAKLAIGAYDQGSWDNALKQASAMGLDVSQVPKQFDPNIRNNIISSSLGAKEYTENQIKQMEAQFKIEQARNEGRKIDVELFKTFGNPIGGQGGSQGNSGQPSQIDPATLVPRSVPPDRQKDVLEEMKRAKNIASNGPNILEAFDRTAKEQRVFSGGNPKNLIPHINSQGLNDLHQLILPNFKTIDGTVRQAPMEETFNNVTPQAFDSDTRVAQRRRALINWIKSESAAPTASSFGINLSNYKNTSFDPDVPSKNDNSKTSVETEIHPALRDKTAEELQIGLNKLLQNKKQVKK